MAEITARSQLALVFGADRVALAADERIDQVTALCAAQGSVRS